MSKDIEPADIYCNSSGGGTWNIWLDERLYCQVSTREVAEKHVRTLREKYVEHRLEGNDVYPRFQCPDCATYCDYEGYDRKRDQYEFYCPECDCTHWADSFEWH